MYNTDQTANLRESGRLLGEALDLMVSNIKEGVSGQDLNLIMEQFCAGNGVTPSFKGFNGFPAAVCVCINNEVVHGIPCDRPFKEGDLITVDAGITCGGMITDAARTVLLGDPLKYKEAFAFNRATHSALRAGIGKVRSGAKIGEISEAIEKSITDDEIHVLHEFCGHGVGKTLHESPQIPNETRDGFSTYTLKSGQAIAIEPITSLTETKCILGGDNWIYKTQNGSLAGQWEETILVLDGGYEILTESKSSHILYI